MTFKDRNLRDKIKNLAECFEIFLKNDTFLDVKRHFLTDVFVFFFNLSDKNFWGFFFHKKGSKNCTFFGTLSKMFA